MISGRPGTLLFIYLCPLVEATVANIWKDMAWTHWRMDFFKCQLSWLKANRPDLPFVLSEGTLFLQPPGQ